MSKWIVFEEKKAIQRKQLIVEADTPENALYAAATSQEWKVLGQTHANNMTIDRFEDDDEVE